MNQTTEKIYDTIIVGGGPAGVAAGVYAARKKMKSLLITEAFGGQSVVSDAIENWIGEKTISGFELAQKLEKHVRAQESIEIKTPEKATGIKKSACGVEVTTDKGTYTSRSLVITAGGHHRKLNIPGEDKLIGKGVSFCSTCDAPFYKDKTVAVVGGGNAGLEAVIDLQPYAKKIYMLLNLEEPNGDPATYEQVKKIDKFELIKVRSVDEVVGDLTVTGLKYTDKETGKAKELKTGGVFVEIGSEPNCQWLGDMVDKNKFGEVIVDLKTGQTSQIGIFAAGDITDDMYKQNNIAVGDAVRAALSAYNYVLGIKKDKSKMADCELTRELRKITN